MSLLERLYAGGIAAARALAPVRGDPARFATWAEVHRDPARPLLHFHAASAGELRQAEPVIRRLRIRQPDWQIGCTVFSPSGLPVARELPVDVFGLLPWDRTTEMSALLDALRPNLIVVSKHDLWPALARAAAARSIPLILIAGTVRPGSGRLRWPARQILRPAYASLAAISAVTEADAGRLVRLGADPARIGVDGDPRADAVLERLAGSPPPARDSTLLVAGSTWPDDERVLLAALVRVRTSHPSARLMLAPHQPTPAAVTRLAHDATRLGLDVARLREPRAASATVVIVDELGPLAFLYAQGVIAYVGGGFGRRGLHSVLEPAACAVPVLVGPAGHANRDARLLQAHGGLVVLQRAAMVPHLAKQWAAWLEDAPARERAATAARATVESAGGAAERIVARILSMAGTHGGPTPGRPS